MFNLTLAFMTSNGCIFKTVLRLSLVYDCSTRGFLSFLHSVLLPSYPPNLLLPSLSPVRSTEIWLY